MLELQPILTALTVAAGAALGVERFIEVLKQVLDSAYSFAPKSEMDIQMHESRIVEMRRLGEDLEKKVNSEPGATADSSVSIATNTGAVQTDIDDDEGMDEKADVPEIPIVRATPYALGPASRAIFIHLVAAGLGIIFAQLYGLKLISVFLGNQENSPLTHLLDIIFTGIIIGGGSKHVHVVIRFITERKISVDNKKDDEETLPEKNEYVDAKAIRESLSKSSLVLESVASKSSWVDFGYDGGIDPQRLENRKFASYGPNLVVYHHTAFSSANSFEDVRYEIYEKKGWSTGYHCIVMPDGKLRYMCRWDRFGNHTRGFNRNSLGIAFHGNFHTIHNDKFSNADGRFGNQVPTEAQLHAGARMIALWVCMYQYINMDFEMSILPHKKAKPGHTVCPGSNFPHEELHKLVTHYYESWVTSPEIEEKIDNLVARFPSLHN